MITFNGRTKVFSSQSWWASSNRGLSFVGAAGRELGEGSLMVRPHLCKSAVRAGDNQGLHTITPTHLSSGETSDAAHQRGLHLADKGRQQRIIIWQSRKVGFCVILNVTPALYCRSHISLSKLCCCDIGVYSCRFM